jgi:hypothetical protein
MSPELAGLYLSDSSNSTSPPVNWRRVESEAKLACSQIAIVEWLLRQTLASIHHNNLHLVQVSLGNKREKILTVSRMASSVLTCPFFSFMSCSRSFYLRVA